MNKLLMAFAASSLALSMGCGPDDNGGQQLLTGQFIDSYVNGVCYDVYDNRDITLRIKTGTGTTVNDGEFHYRSDIDQYIEFCVGDIKFPTVRAARVITPLIIATENSIHGTSHLNSVTVINMIRFLQSLDADGDPSNGIEIPMEAHSVGINKFNRINFDQPIEEFEEGLPGEFIDALEKKITGDPNATAELVSIEDALSHFASEIDVEAVWFIDNDGDGAGDMSQWDIGTAGPPGYVANNNDCDDNDPNNFPGNPEIDDCRDNNCNDIADEGYPFYFADVDGDGYGNNADKRRGSCALENGYIADNTDCIDTNATVYPGATDIVDGIDNDCDGLIDEEYRYIFYTEQTHNGAFASTLGGSDGLAGADAFCQAAADGSTLPWMHNRSWKAWLSDGYTSAASRLEHANVPYKLPISTYPEGLAIASNWSDLTDGSLVYPVDRSQHGIHTGVPRPVWTNTKADGNYIVGQDRGGAHILGNCHNWSDIGPNGIGAFQAHEGINSFYDTGWTYTGTQRLCSVAAHLYCVQQGKGPDCQELGGNCGIVYNNNAKYVFLSSTVHNGDLSNNGLTGLEGADKTCQELADSSVWAPPGTYKAWLSAQVTSLTTGRYLQKSPSNRFSHASVPYILIDGTVIANNWADLTDGTLNAPIDLTESCPLCRIGQQLVATSSNPTGEHLLGDAWGFGDCSEHSVGHGGQIKPSESSNWWDLLKIEWPPLCSVGFTCTNGSISTSTSGGSSDYLDSAFVGVGNGVAGGGVVGNSSSIDLHWSASTWTSCDTPRRLYCVQQ